MPEKIKPKGEMKDSSFELNPELTARLKELGDHVNIDASFESGRTVDENGDPIQADVVWTKVEADGREIEGELYLPDADKSNGEIVILNPGVPGGGVRWLNSRYAPALVKEGFTVFGSRHNGTKMEGGAAVGLVDCPKKQEWAKGNGQDHLGEPFSFEAWGHEVETAIIGLQEAFSKVHLVGHSMGVHNIYSALEHLSKSHPELVDKISRVVSLSGAVGRIQEDGSLDSEGVMPGEKFKGYLGYIKDNGVHECLDPVENMKQMKANSERMYAGDWTSYKNLESSFYTPDTFMGGHPDEYVSPKAADEFAPVLQAAGHERVRVVKYNNPRVDREKKQESHDFANMRVSSVVRWITGAAQESLEKKLSSKE